MQKHHNGYPRMLLITAIALAASLSQTVARASDSEKGSAKVICLGDSITGQPNLARYLKWSSVLECMYDGAKGEGAVRVLNRGIGGDTTEGALKRLQRDVLDENPNVVVIMLGGNDAGQKRQQADVKADLSRIVQKCTAVGAKVLLLQYAMIPNPAQPGKAWTHLDDNNDLIAEVAKSEGVGLLDIAAAMNTALKNQRVTELTGRQNGIAKWETKRLSQEYLVSPIDGVHLSPAGELVFARAIFKKLAVLGWL
ncbi:MAG: lysophospholipase L1-like esterase [Rhodothermales bacterium]|jgi:lysophospholipase L1-like esterase